MQLDVVQCNGVLTIHADTSKHATTLTRTHANTHAHTLINLFIYIRTCTHIGPTLIHTYIFTHTTHAHTHTL